MKTLSSRKWLRLRWLMLLVFPCGYAVTFHMFQGFQLDYFVLTFLSTVSSFVLLTFLGPYRKRNLALWLILSVIVVAYYLKFYILLLFPDFNMLMYVDDFLLIIDSPEQLINSFAIISYAFIAFCLVSILLTLFQRSVRLNDSKMSVDIARFAPVMIALVLFLTLGTAIIMYVYGVAAMGAAGVYLPFRLAGVLFYLRKFFIPSLILLIILCSDKTGSRRYFTIGILLLLFHGVLDMFVLSSRGSLLNLFFMLLFLFVTMGSVTRQRVQVFVFSILATVLMWPLITMYRYVRIGGGYGIHDLLTESAVRASEKYGGPIDSFIEVLSMLVVRLPGADSVLFIVSSSFKPLGLEVLSYPASKFYTYDIMHFPRLVGMALSPSLFGWLYIVGGILLVIIGMFLFVVAAQYIWRMSLRLDLVVAPIAQAMVLYYIFQICLGGLPHRVFYEIIVIIASVVFCEMMVRLSGVKVPEQVQLGSVCENAGSPMMPDGGSK